MADLYRYRSRRSETPSSSSSGGSHLGSPSQYHHTPARPSNLSYAPVNPTHHSSYSTAPPSSQHRLTSPNGPYASPSPPQFDDSAPGIGHHHRSSSVLPSTGVVPRHSSYPNPVAPDFTSERASKRHRASTAPTHSQMQAQWADASAHGQHHPASRRSNTGNLTGRGFRHSDDRGNPRTSVSPQSYSHGNPHDPYGNQLSYPPSLVPATSPSVVNMYDTRHSRLPSSDDEFAEHGPTELPPRTYTGKSQYDPPKKPGKIPGSAMDYLPILEARFDRLETAIDKFVDFRGKQAVSNSILPGMDDSVATYGRAESSFSPRHSRESTRR